MHEFLSTLSFSIVPLSAAAIFSLIAPPLGATLSLRNEILLGIALPSVGGAVMAGAVLAGVPAESTLLLYCITALALFIIIIALPQSAGTRRISLRHRELILAGLFCLGNALTMLFMALSPIAEAHFKYLLQGELLAVNAQEMIVAGILAAIFLAAGVFYRGPVYAYVLDEEDLYIKGNHYRRITMAYRAVATLLITGGIVLIGPLLTTALMIVPAFLCESRCRGLNRFMGTVIVVGFTGTVAGFFLSIFLDLAPAPIIVSTTVVFGFCVRFLPFGKR